MRLKANWAAWGLLLITPTRLPWDCDKSPATCTTLGSWRANALSVFHGTRCVRRKRGNASCTVVGRCGGARKGALVHFEAPPTYRSPNRSPLPAALPRSPLASSRERTTCVQGVPAAVVQVRTREHCQRWYCLLEYRPLSDRTVAKSLRWAPCWAEMRTQS